MNGRKSRAKAEVRLGNPLGCLSYCPARRAGIGSRHEADRLEAGDLALHDRDWHRVVEPGRFRVLVGASSEDVPRQTEFCLGVTEAMEADVVRICVGAKRVGGRELKP